MDCEVKKYKKLNELAEQNGIVIFGGKEDVHIPLGELRQAFSVESKMYNRSINNLSIKNAITVFDECVAPLAPETVLIHIGDADLSFFTENSTEFDNQYRELITHIRTQNKKCRIAVVSLKNYDNDPLITEMNSSENSRNLSPSPLKTKLKFFLFLLSRLKEKKESFPARLCLRTMKRDTCSL